MGQIAIAEGRLRLHFTRTEKVLGVLRDLDVPVGAVVSAERMEGPWHRDVRGFRVGLGLPTVRLLGTWRTRGSRQLVDLRRGLPALKIGLRQPAPYDEVLVSSPRADDLLRELRGRSS